MHFEFRVHACRSRSEAFWLQRQGTMPVRPAVAWQWHSEILCASGYEDEN